jgi:ribose 5-phosphate isomerase B
MEKGVRVYLGSDHAGFSVKEKIKKFLKKNEISYEDLSPELNEGDDYPDVAFELAEKVAKNKDSRGILVCGTGTGMCIAANKVKGIRATPIYDKYSAVMSRQHNNCNIACLRGRKFFSGRDVSLVNLWLSTEFSHGDRHKRRLAKIAKYEK